MARTARQKAAQLKAARASAAKRRGKGRYAKKISRTRARTRKRVGKQASIAQRNAFTHSTHGGIYLNGRGVRAIKKGQRIQMKGQKKIAKYKAKQRRR